MLSDPAPRPERCYDPTTPPHRDEHGVHVYDHPTVRGLLRDPQWATSDVNELITLEQRDRLHPVSSFVWATDGRTLSGRPGWHAAMAAWFAPETAAGGTATAKRSRATTAAVACLTTRAAAVATATTLARRCPHLAMAGAWKHYVGIDDGYVAAPMTTLPNRAPPAPR